MRAMIVNGCCVRKIAVISFLLLASVPCGYTQPGPGSSPEEQAREMADEMKRVVNLDTKQYKTVYNLFVKDFKFIRKVSSQGGMPPMGGGGGNGGSGFNYGGSNGQVGGGISADSKGVGINGNVNLGHGASLNGNIGAGSGGIGLGGGITFGGGGGGSQPSGGYSLGGGGGGSQPSGGYSHGGPGGMPPGNAMRPGPIPDKYLEKEDTKLRKTLSSQQYREWREKHPFDYLTYLRVDHDGKKR